MDEFYTDKELKSFASVLKTYLKLDIDARTGVNEMAEIVDSDDATEDEKSLAMETMRFDLESGLKDYCPKCRGNRRPWCYRQLFTDCNAFVLFCHLCDMASVSGTGRWHAIKPSSMNLGSPGLHKDAKKAHGLTIAAENAKEIPSYLDLGPGGD